MAKQINQKQHESLSEAFEKMDREIAEGVLHDNLHADAKQDAQAKKNKPLSFNTTADKQGHLHHFLQQLAKICHLRGDMIPRAQEALIRKFLLNYRYRHHLQQMSNAHALRSEEAKNNGDPKLFLQERLEAWRKMPRDLSLLLDVAEAYAEPQSFLEQKNTRSRLAKEDRAKPEIKSEAQGMKTRLGFSESERALSAKALMLKEKHAAKQENKQTQEQRKQQERIASELLQLNPWQYRRQAIKYLKKATELYIGLELEQESNEEKASANKLSANKLSEELKRLEQLQQNYPNINWERYAKQIKILKGQARSRWPWVLLALLLLALFSIAMIYLPWRSWLFFRSEEVALQEVVPQLSEQRLLETPVPVEWKVPAKSDLDFDKVIQKSQRLKLSQHYAYEVQGHIRVKPKKHPSINGGNTAHSQFLIPTEPFDLLLTYEHQGQEFKKRIEFSYDNETDPIEIDRAPVMEGDTVLFREVFRLPGGAVNDDRLRAQIDKVGKAPKYEAKSLAEGGFAQPLSSFNIQGEPQPNIKMAFRNQVVRSDGESIRQVGYDLELQNNSKLPLDQYQLRLNWRQENSIYTKENSPILQQNNYTIISASGTNLPGRSRTTQRLWLEVPEGLNYPIEQLTPQVRIIENRFATE